jgi:hypothetical protein
MLAFPDESNRKIARAVGLSEATVRAVRHRIVAGAFAEGRDNPVKPAPDDLVDLSELRQGRARKPDCTRCAGWLAHCISEATRQGLLHDISHSKCPRVIAEALGILELNTRKR